jgi:Flp pilus assembly protein CpaB
MQRPPSAGNKKSKGNSDLAKLLSTRSGLIAVAVFAALVAGGLLAVFLQHYKDSLTDEGTHTVLVAKSVIPKGSSGDVVADQQLFQVSKAQGKEVKNGALTDPAQLHGKVTAVTVYPGQQLTESVLVASSGAVNTKISGNERAISVPMDSAHGLIGDVHAGDHVDVWASFNGSGGGGAVVSLLMRDAVVLQAPDQAKGSAATSANSTQNVVIQAPDPITPKIAYTVDNGKVWIVARPPAGAKDTNPTPITGQNVLQGGGR